MKLNSVKYTEKDRLGTSFFRNESIVTTPTEVAEFIALLLFENLDEIC
jgi:hypothetical protein